MSDPFTPRPMVGNSNAAGYQASPPAQRNVGGRRGRSSTKSKGKGSVRKAQGTSAGDSRRRAKHVPPAERLKTKKMQKQKPSVMPPSQEAQRKMQLQYEQQQQQQQQQFAQQQMLMQQQQYQQQQMLAQQQQQQHYQQMMHQQQQQNFAQQQYAQQQHQQQYMQPPQQQQQQQQQIQNNHLYAPAMHKVGQADPHQNPLQWTIQALESDPYFEPSRVPNFITFWLVILSQSFEISVRQAAVLMDPNDHKIGDALQKGVQGAFAPVRRLCQTLYHNCGKMAHLLQSQDDMLRPLLITLQAGVGSEDDEVTGACCRCLRSLCKHLATHHHQHVFWLWFTADNGGLDALVASSISRRNQAVRKSILMLIAQLCTTEDRASALLRKHLHEKVPVAADYMQLTHDIVIELEKTQTQYGQNAQLLSLETVRHIVNYSFRHAQSRAGSRPQPKRRDIEAEKREAAAQQAYNRGRCAALCLLSDLWLLMDRRFQMGQNEETVMKAILGLIKKAARDRRAVDVQITANTCLFDLLDVFVRGQRPYAPFVYKTLIFSLIESKQDDISLREYMLSTMLQSLRSLPHLPVAVLIEPLLKQASMNGYTLAEIELLGAATGHERLSPKHALALLDLLGKIVLENLIFTEVALQPMLVCIKRFSTLIQVQNFVLAFIKYALDTLMQSESKMAAALDSSSTGALEFHDVDEDMEHALRRIFYDLDVNNNNVVEKRELLRALRDGLPSLYRAVESFPRLKPILKPSSYDQTFLLMSTQSEGVVTYDEFKSFCVKISRQGGDRQNQGGDTVVMTDSQMKRIVILSALQRIVDLRNRKINSNAEPVLSAAQEKFAQMNVTMTNFQNSKSPGGRYLNENAIPNMEEVTLALGEMVAICRATTPPSQQNLSASVNAMMETQEDTAWKGASIADLDSSYTNAKKGGNVVPEPAEVVDRERPQTPPDPDIVVLAKMLKRIHGVLTFRRPSLKSMKEGTMDRREFKRQIFLCLGIKMDAKEAMMTFDWFDKDGGGTLDSAEVLKAFFNTKDMENFVMEVTKRYPVEMARKKRRKKKKGPRRGPGPKATPPGGKSRWNNPVLKTALAKIQDALTLRRPNLDVFKGKTLTREDFKRDLMHALGLNMSDDEVNAVFDHYDDDQSGELDYVEIIRRFFDKKETGKINNAPTLLTSYKGEVGPVRDFDDDSENSEEEDDIDPNVQKQIERALPEDLRGDGFTACTLRKIKDALDAGGADPDLEDDMRAFKGRNLTKKQFKRQCSRILGLNLSPEELDCCFNYFDEDGGGTIEYDELIRGLHGPLHSALTRMKQVLDEDRMARDMSSFKGRSLTKEDFWYQTKVVLGVTLSKAELDAVFHYFDEDGGGSIDYGEILNKFARREHLDLTMAGRSKRRTYRSGIEFRKVNIDRVDRRRKREIERKRIREERRKLRSARIRKALREQFEDRLENRIALGIREPRISISKRQSNLIELHETQVKGKRANTRKMLSKSIKDVQMSRVKARPPTPPERPQLYFNAELLLRDWIFTLKAVFGIYVKYQLSFKRTKRYDFDDLTKTKGTIDETNWLRCMTDFCIVPNLISKYDAKGIFHKSNLTLTPNKADTSIVAQDRPIGMKGPEQWRLCNFEDFISAIVGVAHSRASFFAYQSTSQEKCNALMAYMRDKSVQCNQTKEILKYYNKKKVVSGSVDIDTFLSHGNDAPSCVWRLRRVFGDERAENTQWNAWLHFSTPTFYYEWRLSDHLRRNLGESRWIAIELVDEILNNAVDDLHILQSMKVNTYHIEERKTVLEEILPKLYKKYDIDSPTEDERVAFTAKAYKLYAKRTNKPYRLYKDRKPAEAIPTVPTVDGKTWTPPSKRYENVKVPEHVERLHVDVKHDLLKEMSNEKLKKLDTIERTKAMRSHNSGIGFGTATYMDNRAPMSEEAMKKWNSHATLRKKYFNRDARVDRLAFLGEKARSEMTMGRQVTARWATEIIVRIADECTTGEARQRIEEKCDFDDTKEIGYQKWMPKYTLSRKKGEHLVGLPQYPKGHPMATLRPPAVPKLRPKETEKAVDRKLREDVINKKKALLRERRRRRRQIELAEKLEEAKRNKKQQEVARIQEEGEKNAAEKARMIAEMEAKKQSQEATKLEIQAWKLKREQRKKIEMQNREYEEDVAGRYYSMRVLNSRKHVETIEEKAYKARRVSPTKKHFKADDTTDFDIEELNRRRREAKKKRLLAVKAMEKAKAREKAEFDALEEKLRLANNPLDKVSLKLTMAIKKNQAKLADIFAKIDTDGSGNVTYKEFRRGLFKVGIKLNTKEVHELCKGLDKDGDGVVSYLELKRFMDTSINNTHAAAASIQARWRAKRINMKTKAELKEEYRQKQLREQTMKLTKKSADWKRELETDLVVDQEEYDDHGRKVKKNRRKQGVYQQKSPKRSPKNSLNDSQKSSSSLNGSTRSLQSSTTNSQDNGSTKSLQSSTINSADSKPDIVKWDSTGNEDSSAIDANTVTNWNADNES